MIVDDAAYQCGECRSPLMACPSGSVCPHGHGKLRPPMPTAVRRRNHALLLGLVDVQLRRGGYYVGEIGPLRIVKRMSRQIDSIPNDDYVYGLDKFAILRMELKR